MNEQSIEQRVLSLEDRMTQVEARHSTEPLSPERLMGIWNRVIDEMLNHHGATDDTSPVDGKPDAD